MTLPQNAVKAVVLSGGGAHGAYEVGVLKALMTGASWTTGNVPLDPDIITGTSIGAYNASVLTSRLDIEEPAAVVQYLERVWVDLMPRDGTSGHNHIYRFRGNPAEYLSFGTLVRNPAAYFSFDSLFGLPARSTAELSQDAVFFAQDWLRRGLNFFSPAPATLGQRFLQLIDLSTLISREPTERLLQQTLVMDNIRRSRRLLFLAVTNWVTGRLEYFRNADMTDANGALAILASSAIPGVFPPVEVNGKTYVDGGLSLNTPLAPAFVFADPGADTAHVIYLDPLTEDIPIDPLRSTIGTMDRMMTISLSKAVDSDMRIASRVNRGLDLVESASKGEPLIAGPMVITPLTTLIRSASYLIDGIGGKLPDSPKTIHRYRPSRYLGGTLSLLNFSRQQMVDFIKLGFQDVLNHDCKKSQCVIPGGPPLEALPQPTPFVAESDSRMMPIGQPSGGLG